MSIVSRLRNNGLLHKIHLWTDISIGVFALFGLVGLLIGIEEVLEAFFNVDLVFHLVIIAFAFGGILAEKILHGKKHKGMSTHSEHNKAVVLTPELVKEGRYFAEKLNNVLLRTNTVSSVSMVGNSITINFRDGDSVELIAFPTKYDEDGFQQHYLEKIFPKEKHTH